MAFVGSPQLLAGVGGIAALLTGGTIYMSGSGGSRLTGSAFVCTVDSITDGDTLRCIERGADGRAIRIRLSGIAARERDGSCTQGHPCPDAAPEAATAALERLAGGYVLRCHPVGTTYGRVAAFCRNSGGADLSCAMVASGTVAKWERHWRNHRC